MGVSRQSPYYKPELSGKDLRLKAKIDKVMADYKAYGYKRIALDSGINKKRVLRVMKILVSNPKEKERNRKTRRFRSSISGHIQADPGNDY